MDYDDAYANAPYIDGAALFPPRWQEEASAFATAQDAAGRRQAGIAYGTHARERFDLFRPEGAARGLMVFVHGGYWLKFDRSYWFHLAQGALARGWAVAMPSYVLCPEVRIADITASIAKAIATAADLVDGPVALAGHSAGGHLVARMLEPGLLCRDVAARLTHVMPISPVSDLAPLVRTKMNAELRIDAAEAEVESPVRMKDRLDVPVTVWVGADERPVFLDQARWLAEAWSASHVIDAGKHHFDVIEPLTDAGSDMMQRLLG